MPIDGYPSATSVAPGETITFQVSADPEDMVTISIFRVAAAVQLMLPPISATASPQSIPPRGAEFGFNWSVTAPLTIPEDWPSGLYRVELNAPQAGAAPPFHFVVRAASAGSTSPILLMFPATTRQAYNGFGGFSLYENDAGARVNQVSFDRPGGLDYPTEVPFARWFDASGIATESCTNLDIHQDPMLPLNYQLLVSMGHDEYWSMEMRDAVEAFINGGGNVAFFSGNVCWWQVRIVGRIMVCYKDAAADPLADADATRVTVNWPDASILRSQNTLAGVGWRKGSMVNGSATGYVCRFADHWVFDGTGLSNGDIFGGTNIGYETDACDFEETDGDPPIPRATGRDGTPSTFVILATADYTQVGTQPGFATMGIYRRAGTVFTAAAVNWGQGLDAGDSNFDIITRNVVRRLTNRFSERDWQRIGEANNVVAMAAMGGELFAATGDGLLWQRDAVAQNLHWDQIGDSTGIVDPAGGIIAMAAIGYSPVPASAPTLFALTRGNLLWSRDLVPGASWSSIGVATAIALAASHQPLKLFAADSAYVLWMRDPQQTSFWEQIGTAVNVAAMAAQYRSLLMVDSNGAMWRRDTRLDTIDTANWMPLGPAVSGLTAIAVTEEALFAATHDNVLWKRDLFVAEELQLAGVTNDGSMFHTIRREDRFWEVFGNVKDQTGDPGVVTAVTASGVAGELQLVAVTNDGNISHTIRHADGHWELFGDVKKQAGDKGIVTAVAAASVAGELQLAAVTNDGNIWHTIRHQDRTWEVFGNVKSQAGDIGVVTAVSAAGVESELQLVAVTGDGNISHTIRHSDAAGSWEPFWPVKGEAGDIGAVTAVTAAGVAGELQLVAVTNDGNIWHTIRHLDGSWETFGNVKDQIGDTGVVTAVTATGVEGELQFAAVTNDGGIWHTIRHFDGSWEALGDVKQQAGDEGIFTAIATASTPPPPNP